MLIARYVLPFVSSLAVLLSIAQASESDVARIKAIDATPASRNAAMKAGQKASFFCANCHGSDGNSRFPDVPNLASQNSIYLLNQIDKFATGTRKNQFMEGLVKALSEDERLKIAYYFSNSTVISAGASGNIARGKEVFHQNCAICHGDQAHGAEGIPRLAGQQAQYLRLSIGRYRDKSGERIFPPMSAAVGSLKPEEVDAVVSYLANIH